MVFYPAKEMAYSDVNTIVLIVILIVTLATFTYLLFTNLRVPKTDRYSTVVSCCSISSSYSNYCMNLCVRSPNILTSVKYFSSRNDIKMEVLAKKIDKLEEEIIRSKLNTVDKPERTASQNEQKGLPNFAFVDELKLGEHSLHNVRHY